jgi:hypothetical protein
MIARILLSPILGSAIQPIVSGRDRCHSDTQSYESNFGIITGVSSEETNRSREAEKVHEKCGNDRCTIVVVRERGCNSENESDHAQSLTTTRHRRTATCRSSSTFAAIAWSYSRIQDSSTDHQNSKSRTCRGTLSSLIRKSSLCDIRQTYSTVLA